MREVCIYNRLLQLHVYIYIYIYIIFILHTYVYILTLLSKKHNSNNIGLYSVDGLSVFRNISKQQAEKPTKSNSNNFPKVKANK